MNLLSKVFSCKKTKKKHTDNYTIGVTTGVPGSFGKVFKGSVNETHETIAIKRISKKKYVSTELSILKIISHPNIIHFVDYFENDKNIYIVFEYCRGDLYDIIQENKGKLSEKETILIVSQILKALRYLHALKIAHCDIKLSNIMYVDQNIIKLIDFGMSQIVPKSGKLHKFVGSLGFMSPEMIMGSYDTQTDIWSLGCVVFILLFGFNPFNPMTKTNWDIVSQNILIGFNNTTRDGVGAFFPKSIYVSDLAKDFISNLLVLDSKERLSADELLEHPWITQY